MKGLVELGNTEVSRTRYFPHPNFFVDWLLDYFMNRILILALFLPVLQVCGQVQTDTLTLWSYNLHKHVKPQKDKSIGQISFYRTKPVNDSVYFARHQEHWTPQITFALYPLSDSVYCKEQSSRFKTSSSCYGPDVGGDLFMVGNFILLNRDACLSCLAYESKKDFCRPAITKLLDSIDKRKIKTFSDLEKQMVIAKGKSW